MGGGGAIHFLMHRRLFARRLDTCFPTIRNHSSIILSRSVRVSHIRAPSRNISLTVVPSSLRKEQSCSSKKRHNASNPRTMYISKPSLYEILLCTLDFFFLQYFSLKKGNRTFVFIKIGISLSPRREEHVSFTFSPVATKVFFFLVCISIYVYMRTCIYIYTHVYTYIYTRVCVYFG